ncbi:hypothetical protein HII36_26875 [Nonomuraea sp. NN258]|uniref:hypothetical protein n=1 Tax=Nonomuraea antri TaxID=2730852 RepID=UPI00156939A3|nr:hypothetical protein [Nonomuraea antri]NRQ35426.1 hypothetical protein [Nonomuraea antri]
MAWFKRSAPKMKVEDIEDLLIQAAHSCEADISLVPAAVAQAKQSVEDLERLSEISANQPVASRCYIHAANILWLAGFLPLDEASRSAHRLMAIHTATKAASVAGKMASRPGLAAVGLFLFGSAELLLGKFLLAEGDEDRAVTFWEGAVETLSGLQKAVGSQIDASTVEPLIEAQGRLANLLSQLGRQEQAYPLALEAVAMSRDLTIKNAAALRLHSGCALGRAQNDESGRMMLRATVETERATHAGERLVFAMFQLGSALGDDGQFAEAVGVFEEAQRLLPVTVTQKLLAVTSTDLDRGLALARAQIGAGS